MKYNPGIGKRFSTGKVVLMVIIFLSIRFLFSCAGDGGNLKEQVTCEVLYLKSDLPEDIPATEFVLDHFSRLDWGTLKETEYSALNRNNEIWYRVILPGPVNGKSVLLMPAYSHGFKVLNGNQISYQSANKSGALYLRVHVIPVLDSDEPVFIHFNYRNYNNAIIRYPVYLVSEGDLTEILSVNKFNPFTPSFGMIFPGIALCVLGLISVLLFLRRRFKEYNTFLYFGMASLMTGILYILPLAKLGRINLSPDWYFAVEHFVVHVLLIFFILLNISIFNAGKSLLYKVLIIILIIFALLDFPVFLFHPLPFHSSVITGLLVSVFFIASVITGYRDTRSSGVTKRFMYYMQMLTYLMAIGDVVLSLVFPQSDIVFFGIGILVYALSVVYYLEDQYSLNLGRSQQFFTELEFRKNEILRLEQKNLRSQFNALKSQINPHFLFNSLNILTSLIRKDPDLSEKYVEQLSKTYRYILEFKSEELVPLQAELEFIRAYLFLMKLRFGDKLNVEISSDLYQVNCKIPHLSLQMLIENAVKHNTFSTKSPLQIRMSVADGNIRVSNNLQPRTTKEISTGIGLKNIEERYRLVSDKIPHFGSDEKEFTAKLPLIEHL